MLRDGCSITITSSKAGRRKTPNLFSAALYKILPVSHSSHRTGDQPTTKTGYFICYKTQTF